MNITKAVLDRKIYSNSLKKLVSMKLLGTVAESPRQRRLKEQQRQQLTERKRKVHQAINQLVESKHKYQHEIDSVIKQLVAEKQLTVEMENFRKRHTFRNYRIKTERGALQDQYVSEGEQESQEEKRSDEKSIGKRQEKQTGKNPLPPINLAKRMLSEPSELQRQVERDSLLKVAKHIRISSLKTGQLRLDLQRLKDAHGSRFRTALQPQTEIICLRSKGIPISLKW